MAFSPNPRKDFRELPVSERSIWSSWAALAPKTRLKVSLVVTGVALAGIFISDKLEQKLPAEDHAHTTTTKYP
ncbi:hypothetical protein BDY19DRAFT_988272 [Irpex rosettiformis]|uniref:Uncharacterized protein n=1 Tax=Irpex rosettiformis TaxID=378272 RepID=A0ACB8UJD4_9APHY|nr:hypothetical protein BDY19DRAFT_988272 [Irpex rosettiformis]